MIIFFNILMEVINYFKQRNITGGGLEFQQARLAVFQKGIKSSYEPIPGESHDTSSDEKGTESGIGKRMVFSLTSRARAETMTQLSNGLIVERDTWRPLVIPPPTSQGSLITSLVDNMLAQELYEIYPIQDGTTVHLYYFGDAWRISTANSYDVTNINFTNTQLTYLDILNDVLSHNGHISFAAFTQHLNKSCSYSCVVTHPDIHLYWKGRNMPYRIVLIHRADLASFTCHKDWNIILESESKEAVQPKVPDVQKPINFFEHQISSLTIKQLKNMCNNAFAEENTKLREDLEFGVILRTKDPATTGNISYITLESEKYNNIKHMLYDNTIYRNMQPDFDRENYILLHSYLSHHYHDIFIDMFPMYKNLYDSIKARFASLVGHLVRMYSNEKTITTGGKQYKITSKHPELIISIKKRIDEIVTINVDDPGYDKLINSYIMNSDMTSVLYPYIFV